MTVAGSVAETQGAQEEAAAALRLALTTPRLRSDLIIARTDTAGQQRYTIKVPDTEQYFQLGEDEYRIICLMDGSRNISALMAACEQELGLEIAARPLWEFVKILNKSHCLVVPGAATQTKKQKPLSSSLKNAFYINKHVFNPDRMLDYLEPRLRFLFTPGFLILVAVAFVVSVGIILSHTDRFIFELSSLGSVSGFISLYFAAAVVTALHEIAHGLTCKHFGGRVPSMGALLILLTFPCFYTDVSDAWLFENKRQRIWVTAAGVIFESFLWSAATLLWLVTETDALIHQICLGVMISSAMGMLLSANPLLKFDGYYLISDALEIPNLRSKSMAYTSIYLGTFFGGSAGQLPRVSPREKRIFLIYGCAVILFTIFILGNVVLLLSGVAVEELGAVFLLPVAYVFWLLLGPTFKGIWAGMTLAKQGETGTDNATEAQATAPVAREQAEDSVVPGASTESAPQTAGSERDGNTTPPERRHTGKLLLVLVLVALVASYFVEGTIEVSGQAQLKPVAAQSIEPSIHGLIREIYVREGSVVAEGDPLLKIDDESLLAEIKSAEASLLSARKELILLENGTRPEVIAAKRGELSILRADVTYYKDAYERLLRLPDSVARTTILQAKHNWESAIKRVAVSRDELALLRAGTPTEEIEAKRAAILSLEAGLEKLKQDLRNTEVFAPISGVVVTREPENLIGKYTAQGSAVLEIEHSGAFKARIQIKERDIAEIAIGQPVRLKVYGYPGKQFNGRIEHISTTVQSATIDSLVVPAIEVEASMEDPEGLLKTGMNGIARIKGNQYSYLELVFRKIIHWFRIEFWI
ncbi:HlyD family efflux transporter periplasmic adaptor subunit [Spongiibacter sp. KMU-166]|uniref:HlyD family efflux transporter periplasmic adaptor subunit n=1 Tax=Spongiibacter thalassae TaxID=2721624 RepID=A0ABX1GJX2_9GAMM|nr:efflux RND transporter periplasmic adaptor subunit [Spongiibacter thalassae]NKI19201.1 HlyD family efflux transporter periplasmic adaptor subunit [Spongiibacter thalassae]